MIVAAILHKDIEIPLKNKHPSIIEEAKRIILLELDNILPLFFE